jgi:hypothetical protein
MVAGGRVHPCRHGKHGSLLEAGFCGAGRSGVGAGGGQRAARQEGSGTEDGRQGCGMASGFALPRAAALQFRSSQAHPRATRFNPLPAQTSGDSGSGAQSLAESARGSQYQVSECGLGVFLECRGE